MTVRTNNTQRNQIQKTKNATE